MWPAPTMKTETYIVFYRWIVCVEVKNVDTKLKRCFWVETNACISGSTNIYNNVYTETKCEALAVVDDVT